LQQYPARINDTNVITDTIATNDIIADMPTLQNEKAGCVEEWRYMGRKKCILVLDFCKSVTYSYATDS